MDMKTFTAAIIGGGPAGCECALWLKLLGFHPVIIESSNHLGGLQSLNAYQNQWIVGMQNITGQQLAKSIQSHVLSKEIPVMFNKTVSTCQDSPNGFILKVGDEELKVKFIVLATGSKKTSEASSHAANQAEHDLVFSAQPEMGIDGWQANLPAAFDIYRRQLLDDVGFIITNQRCETPVTGIFAVGEAANRMHPSVVTSMADGAVAAKAIQTLCG